MTAAPKNRPNARRINAVARAEMNRPRVCERCEEEKLVCEQNFSLSNKGLRGWANVCRQCQTVASAENRSQALKTASSQGSRSKSRGRQKYDDDQSLIERMYLMAETGRDHDAEEIADELAERVLELPDRASFRLFMRTIAPLIGDWTEPGAIHDDIIDGLLSPSRRRQIIATRYSAKSTLTSMWVTWRLFRDPLMKILVVSRGSSLAKRMLRTVRVVFIGNCPMLRHLKPTDECVDNAEQFQTPHTLKQTVGGLSFTSIGVGSNMPGLRADLTIGDDVEGSGDDTPDKVAELTELLNELHMINPKGEKILLGTYQSEFSIYAQYANLTDGDGTPIWETHRALMFEDTDDGVISRWPARFSDEDGKDWKRAVTQRAWRLHVLLIADPEMLNMRPLRISDFVVVDWSPLSYTFPAVVVPGGPKLQELSTWGAPKGDDWYGAAQVHGDPLPYTVIVTAVDPASGLAGRDAIGVAVLGVTQAGLGVVLHLEGVRGPDKATNMRRVATIVSTFRTTSLLVEETEESFFGSTLEVELALIGFPTAVTRVKTGGLKKGQRIIDALAPPMGQGRLVMLQKVAQSDHGGQFVSQLVKVSYDGRTGKAKDHDDIVDALAHAVQHVKGSLISDIAENLAASRTAQLEGLRYVPTRFGGLGGREDTPRGHRTLGPPGTEGHEMSLGELLLEEDAVEIELQQRIDRMNDQIQVDRRRGMHPDPGMLQRLTGWTRQLRTLREAQIL